MTHYQDSSMDVRVACGAPAYGSGAPVPAVASAAHTSCRACLEALRGLIEAKLQQLATESTR